MENLILLGRGKTAEVYKWGNDKVLKLFFERYGDNRVQYEAEIGNIVNEAGLPSPCVYDTIKVNGRKGIIFEKIQGNTLFRRIEMEPWNQVVYARQLARFHCGIHNNFTNKLPSQKERFTAKIERSSKTLGSRKRRILEYMESLPGGNRVCHGDLHLRNVISTNKGFVAVDWNSACTGNPAGDVARTCLIISSPPDYLKGSEISSMISSFPRRAMCRSYLCEYLKHSKIRREDVDEWLLPVAAARIKDKSPEENEWLLGIIEKYMQKYGV